MWTRRLGQYLPIRRAELAVINLAVNAKDAMPEGGQLTLSARNARPAEIDIAGEFVVLTVADTGTGIDAELTERIFEPFFTTKPPEQGTGLGLSQVYGLCAQAGGTARRVKAWARHARESVFARDRSDAFHARCANPTRR